MTRTHTITLANGRERSALLHFELAGFGVHLGVTTATAGWWVITHLATSRALSRSADDTAPACFARPEAACAFLGAYVARRAGLGLTEILAEVQL